ncbi:MAG: ABC transporter ATP-binding protein [Frankiales bacterium]|nr:MAG: ABC transporter ATP-binding protein [Frankiales bacterium]
MTLDVHVRRHVVDAAFTVPDDGVTAVLGPSGAGKTTVLRAVAGLERTAGHIRFGAETWDGEGAFVPARARGVGYLSQDAALFPHLDVDANVAYGLSGVGRAERPGRVREALVLAGAAHLAGRRTTELSGGEAQRVALARALAPGPRLLLLDEPLSALDAPTRARLRSDLRHALVRAGVPTLLVTHDRTEALALADRVVVLVDGTVRQTGSPQDVFERPVDAAVAAVVGVETAVAGRVAGGADGLLTVTIGETDVHAVDRGQVGDVLVCIRAEDVALEPADAARSGSARNRLESTVTAVTDEGPLLRVDLDAGFHLAAYVTRPAAAELELRPGLRVQAVVKSPAVHLVER